MHVSLCASGRMHLTQVFGLCFINLPMEGKKVIKTIKRLAACLLITVFIFGSLTLTSAEAAMKKNLHYQHVYYAQVRALKVNSYGEITQYSPWSNIVFITPFPKNVTGRKGSGMTEKLSWNIIYGSNGYNVWLTTNPSGTWYWNLSTNTKATSTSATVKKYRGSSLKTYTSYYVMIYTRRKRNGVFCTVPEPYKGYYQIYFYYYYR